VEEALGRWLIILGLTVLAVGAILQFAPWLISWFGRLPGDIRVETGRSRIFVPVTSMIIVSIVLSLLINWFRR